MSTRCALVYLGAREAALQRVVRDQKDETALGIQTGVIRHAHDEIPVGRPANPRALGLDRSWRDGHWRNIYHVMLETATEEGEHHARELVDANGVAALLPAAKLVRTTALDRYLRQQR